MKVENQKFFYSFCFINSFQIFATTFAMDTQGKIIKYKIIQEQRKPRKSKIPSKILDNNSLIINSNLYKNQKKNSTI